MKSYAAALAGWLLIAGGAANAALFVPGSPFQFQATNSPNTFNNTVPLTPGTYSLGGGTLNLTLSIVPAGGQDEWLAFNYQVVGGGVLSQPGQFWDIGQVGLDAAVPVNFIAAFVGFTNNGTFLTPTSSIFGGYSPGANPVPGESGNGLVGGPFLSPFPAGPLPDLGAFIRPFGFLGATGIDVSQVNGFEQALEFAPQHPITTPEPASIALFGFGLLGLACTRRRAAGPSSGTQTH